MSSGLIPFDDEPSDGPLPVLEKYTILRKLAAGGMASIYVAEQRGSGEICVVKTLHEHLAQDSVVGNRFLREARVASELRHKNIARLMDAKSENGIFYLAMEFIAGHDLESMMFKLMEQRKMLPPELSVRVTLDVLEGLHHAHQYVDASGLHLEIVHRDLSPRNVMITYEGEVKIIDFGLARTNLGEFRTAPGMVLGTLRYMSPEQAVAEPVDRRSDLYSWAVVLYEMLSGRPLVTGANAQEILHAVVTRIPPPLSALNSNLPKGLDAVLAKGMEKEREDRFATAEEMARAIEEAAPELCKTKQSKIGRFVASVFPDERVSADDLARRTPDVPDYEPTRAGQNELTAANVPSPTVAPLPSGSSGELTPEHFVPTNMFVAPNSLYSMSAAQVPQPRRTTLWLVMLMAAASMLFVLAMVGVPKTRQAPQIVTTTAAPPPPLQPPPDPVVAARPIEPAAPPPPVEKPKPRPAKVRSATPPETAPPARKEPPPPPVQRREVPRRGFAWETEVDSLVEDGRLSDALKLMLNRAKAIGDKDAERCAHEGVAFPTAADVAKCTRILREAEQKR